MIYSSQILSKMTLANPNYNPISMIYKKEYKVQCGNKIYFFNITTCHYNLSKKKFNSKKLTINKKSIYLNCVFCQILNYFLPKPS